MSAEQSKSAVHRLVHELFNRTDVRVADAILAPGYVEHDPILGRWSGAEGLKQLTRSLRAAFPDGHMTINDQVAHRDRVVTRWAFRGTQFGAFAGLPASGQGVWITGISIHRVADGVIQEGWTGFERVKWGAGDYASASSRAPASSRSTVSKPSLKQS
jgi:steroid delta-isomerase-like uncharacterized protein